MKLISRPPIIRSSYEKLIPKRFDRVNLYYKSSSRSTNNTNDYRYKLLILDAEKVDQEEEQQCTVFFIPQGRESEYLFRTYDGLSNIIKSAKTKRLIAIVFHRNHQYDSLSSCQEELQSIAKQLAPLSNPENTNYQIPFVAMDGIGHRDIIKREDSFLIEQVKHENERIVRRLYFDSNDLLIQTEAALKNDNEIDYLYLGFEYHVQICAGMALLLSQNSTALIIGVGGASLINFLSQFQPNLNLIGIEIDKKIISIAQEYFGLDINNENLAIKIGNGLHLNSNQKHAIQLSTESFDVIVIDVDSKDLSCGMSCPPTDFIEESYLQTLRDLLSTNSNACLIINVCARDPDMMKVVMRNVSSVFSKILVSQKSSQKQENEVNHVLFAMKYEAYQIIQNEEERIQFMRDYCKTIFPTEDLEIISDLENYCVALQEYQFIESTPEVKQCNNKQHKKKKNHKKKKGKK